MNERKHFMTTVEEIRQCLDEGLTLRQTAERLNCSIQGLRQACSLLELSAIESFSRGQATPADWRAVSDFLNIAETMARGGVGPEVLSACLAVDAALEDAHRRYVATGRLGMTGPQLLALRELHEWHDLQRKSIARSEYERWIQRTANLIRSAHPSVRKVFA